MTRADRDWLELVHIGLELHPHCLKAHSYEYVLVHHTMALCNDGMWND